jgi:hypothetical protein
VFGGWVSGLGMAAGDVDTDTYVSVVVAHMSRYICLGGGRTGVWRRRRNTSGGFGSRSRRMAGLGGVGVGVGVGHGVMGLEYPST